MYPSFCNRMYACFLILISLSHHFVHSETIQVYIDDSVEITTAVSVIEGNQMELKCNSTDAGASFRWTKEGDPAMIVNSPKLNIQSVQRPHAGQYTCTVRLSTGKETGKTLTVNVLYPPGRPTIEGPSNVVKYTSFSLTCHVDSNPAASYWWTHTEDPSAKLIARGSTVTIDRLDSSDIWLYCHAENTMFPTVGEGLSVSRMWQKQVVAQKAVYITELQEEYTFNVGTTLDIKCRADGFPEPISWWTKESDENFERSGNRLIEENVQAEFAGAYACNVENTLEPTDGAKQMKTDRKETIVKIVDPTIPEVCRNISCLYRDTTSAPASCPTTSSCPVAAAAGSEGDNKGAIAAAVVGWIIAVIAVAVAVILWLRSRRHTKDVSRDEEPLHMITAPTTPVYPDSGFAKETRKPDLPQRPALTKQTSEHVYLDLHPYGENTSDYVSHTEETPSDGYEKPLGSADTVKQNTSPGRVPQENYDSKSNSTPQTSQLPDHNVTNINNLPGNQDQRTKRLDSYEHPDEHI